MVKKQLEHMTRASSIGSVVIPDQSALFSSTYFSSVGSLLVGLADAERSTLYRIRCIPPGGVVRLDDRFGRGVRRTSSFLSPSARLPQDVCNMC